MKYLILLCLLSLGICEVSASTKSLLPVDDYRLQTHVLDSMKVEKFKVYGNCGMCKKTIEGALKDIPGIEKAEWNVKSKEMSVKFDSKTIKLNAIKQKIADVGYDTETHRAKEEVYNKLHGCCQYDRPAIKEN